MSTRVRRARWAESTAPGTNGTQRSSENGTRTGPNPWLTLTVVSGGLFLAVLSTTVVSVALPSIGGALHVGATGLEWIVDAYVLVYATLLVTGGALGDRYGRKGLFLLGIGLFAVGSLVTGVAPSVAVLLVGRVLQGVGPALLVPGSLTIIRATFEDERRRALAIGLWSMSSGLAMALGPVLGGLLVAGGGWRWVFLFNVPLALILLAVAARAIPVLPRAERRAAFDWPGATLSTVGVALLVFAVIDGQAAGWTAVPVLIGFVLGGAALVWFVLAELRRSDPLIDVRLFANKAFTVANLAAFVVFFAFIGIVVYLSAYLQSVAGRSAVTAGLDIAILGVALAVSSALTGKLVQRTGERLPMIVGLFVSGAAILALLPLGRTTGVGGFWWQFVLTGLGIGLCGTVTTTIAMSAVGAERAGMASAIVNALRQVGQVFGVAVLGAVVYAGLPGGSSSERLGPARGEQFVAGLHGALWVAGGALVAVGALALLLLLRRPSGNRSSDQDAAAEPRREPAR